MPTCNFCEALSMSLRFMKIAHLFLWLKLQMKTFIFFRRLVGIINNSFTWCCSLVWVHMCSLYNEKAVGFMFVITHSWLIKGYNYNDYTFNWLSYTNVTIFPRNAYRWISNQSAHFFFLQKVLSDNKS